MFGTNARPVIADLELSPLRRLLPAHFDVGTRRSMVDGVVHQIGNRAAQLILVTEHLQIFIHPEIDLMITATKRLRLTLQYPQH
ncbi:hypothetical protein D3C71_1892610 [compost metagenome]